MRLRFLLLPLSFFSVLAATSCRSSDTAPETPESTGEATETPVGGGPGAEAPPQTPSEQLAADAERLQVKEGQRAFLASKYIEEGDTLLERAALEEALAAYSSAISVDPSNQVARERFQKVEAMLGDRFAAAADVLDDEVEREIVRRTQARISAERADKLGDTALSQGEYDLAIERYREAELILRYHPLVADGTLDEQLVAGKLARAIELRDEAELEAERRARETARLAAQEAELRERQYRENRLITLYNEANSAFLNEQYARAEALCQQILLEDQDNEAAQHLLAIASEARHLNTAERNRRDYREQWLRTFEELDTMNVLQNESVLFDDLRRWKEVSQREPLEMESVWSGGTGDDEKAVVLRRLEETRFKPNFAGEDGEGAALEDVAAFLQSLTGVNFVLSAKVRDELDEEEKTITLDLPESSVKKILDLISETSENLRWKIEDGVVKFVTKEELTGGQVLRFYEVRDLIHPIPDFAGREMNIQPSGGLEFPEEEFDERESNVVTSDLLETLIRGNIARESWDEDPRNSITINEMGVMVVNQTPEVHEKIEALLTDLREATGIMVDIQSRFLQVEDNFLEDIGVDFRGLGQPGLGTNEFLNDFGDSTTQLELGREIGTGRSLGAYYDEGQDGDIRSRVENLYDRALGNENTVTNAGGLSFQWTYLNDVQLELILRAVSKSERVELVSAPSILVMNTGRSNLTVVNQVVYVKDFDVEIAQAASIADPIIDVVNDGVILDVRPVVSADRRFITLELRPTIAQLQRPIEQRVTTLGSQNSVTIELPEVDIRRVRTSIPMPDGATVLLGGLKVSDRKDMSSGVPVLNKIPIIRAFFDRKGKYVSNSKLLILLNANIVISTEHEPTPAQMEPVKARAIDETMAVAPAPGAAF